MHRANHRAGRLGHDVESVFKGTQPQVAAANGTATYPWLNEPADSPPRRDVVAPVPRVCLSRSEAARALGIGLTTLKGMEREGSAPPYFDAPGGRRLYPVQGLTAWAEERAGIAGRKATG